jgi:hypothetical protein
MKRNYNKYEQVDKLPIEAQSVTDFCKDQGYSTSNLYNQYKKKKNKGFKIVVFQGFNFIVPEKSS